MEHWNREFDVRGAPYYAVVCGSGCKDGLKHELTLFSFLRLGAARLIQSAWRGHQARRVHRPAICMAMKRWREHRAASRIQQVTLSLLPRHAAFCCWMIFFFIQ